MPSNLDSSTQDPHLWHRLLDGHTSDLDTAYKHVSQMLRRAVYETLQALVSLPQGQCLEYMFLFRLARTIQVLSHEAGTEAIPSVDRSPSIVVMLDMFRDGVQTLLPDDLHPETWDDPDGLLIEFVGKYTKVRTPVDTLSRAVFNADRYPIKVNDPFIANSQHLSRLASIAFRLQEINGHESNIYLPVGRIGRALGRPGPSGVNLASECIQRLVTAGIVECVVPEYDHRRRKAKEYRFCLERRDLYEA